MKKYIIILFSMLLLAGSLASSQTIKRQKQKTEQTQKSKDSKKSSQISSKSTKTENQKSNNSSTKNKTQKVDFTEVIYTGDIASRIIGYNGTTPLNITVKNGVIESIEVLENQESPSYLKRAQEKVLPQYIGKTVSEAKILQPDIATGATYTSEALIKNIQMGLGQAKTTPVEKNTSRKRPSDD